MMRVMNIQREKALAGLVDRNTKANQTDLIESAFTADAISRNDIVSGDPNADVREWWLVSEWFAYQLTQRGEVIIRWFGASWWGRATAGQAVRLDSVIEQIAGELGLLPAEAA